MGEIHLLGNPAAGRQGDDTDQVERLLHAAGESVVRLAAASAVESAAAARAAVAAGAERLVVVGGDGMVRLALGAVAQTATVLGIVPQGTGNDFARALGLPTDLEAAVGAALAPARPVDAMRTTHGWVASVATFGFAGDVTERANRLRWPRGGQRYTVATLAQLPHLRTIEVVIQIDGEAHPLSTTMLAVGNTAYFGGGMAVCPNARPDDGLLHTTVVGGVSALTFLRVFPQVFNGTHISHPAVRTYASPTVTLDGDAAITVWADGDRLGPLPVTCEVVPGAVLVAGVVPA